ncbi:hypothetical protein PLESTM_001013900 [Pleodorina starrii]|nr:hypothetical protein PLESTM_001013900 [Pleodorina starrii]
MYDVRFAVDVRFAADGSLALEGVFLFEAADVAVAVVAGWCGNCGNGCVPTLPPTQLGNQKEGGRFRVRRAVQYLSRVRPCGAGWPGTVCTSYVYIWHHSAAPSAAWCCVPYCSLVLCAVLLLGAVCRTAPWCCVPYCSLML